MNWTLFIKPLPTELLTDYPYINAQLEDINLKLLGPQNHKIPILIELQQHLMDKREKLAKDGYDIIIYQEQLMLCRRKITK